MEQQSNTIENEQTVESSKRPYPKLDYTITDPQ